MIPDNDDQPRERLVRILGDVTADSFARSEVVELVRLPVSVVEASRVKGLGEG